MALAHGAICEMLVRAVGGRKGGIEETMYYKLDLEEVWPRFALAARHLVW